MLDPIQALASASDPAIAMIADASLKGAVVLAAGWLVALFVRRSAAAVRHLVWSVAFGGLLALPVLSAMLPSWRVEAFAPLERLSPDRPAPAAALARTVPATRERAAAPATPEASGPRVVAPVLPRSASQVVAAEQPAAPGGAGVDLITLMVLVWLTGATLVIAPLVVGMARVWWLSRTATRIVAGEWSELARPIIARLGIRRPVRLLESSASTMPVAWGIFRPTVLIPTEAHRWTAAQRRDVLIHELAHIARHDPVTQLVVQLVCALYWFNPLVWLGAARVRMTREQACDDCVLAAGARASDYAGHLLDVARSLRPAGATALAAIAMARRSQLSDRLLAILDAERERGAVPRRLARSGWLIAACVIVPLAAVRPAAARVDVSAVVARPSPEAAAVRAEASTAPSTPAAAGVIGADCVWRPSSNSSTSIQHHDDEIRVRWSNGRCRLEIRSEGKVTFSADDTDVIGIARGGYFIAEERDEKGTKRELEIRPGNDGQLRRTWQVDGSAREYDAEARAWLAGILPDIFRRTGWNAEERSRRILQERGNAGLLAEVSQIPTAYVKRQYLAPLLADSAIDVALLQQILRQAGREIDSDYELAELLIAASRRHLGNENVRTAYVEATRSIGSDYEKRRVLDALLARGTTLSGPVVAALLESAATLDSDYEMAELLIAVARNHSIGEAILPAYFHAVGTISSDYEHRRVLSAVAARADDAPRVELVRAMLESAKQLGSDYERAELLIDLAQRYSMDDAARNLYLDAAEAIGSEYERDRALAALVRRRAR